MLLGAISQTGSEDAIPTVARSCRAPAIAFTIPFGIIIPFRDGGVKVIIALIWATQVVRRPREARPGLPDAGPDLAGVLPGRPTGGPKRGRPPESETDEGALAIPTSFGGKQRVLSGGIRALWFRSLGSERPAEPPTAQPPRPTWFFGSNLVANSARSAGFLPFHRHLTPFVPSAGRWSGKSGLKLIASPLLSLIAMESVVRQMRNVRRRRRG